MPGVSYLQLHLQISQGFWEGFFVCSCLSLLTDSGKSPTGSLRIIQFMFVGEVVCFVVLLGYIRAKCYYPMEFS